MGTREANKQATRRALEAAAEQLFAERGVVGTTVRDIAAAAGVTERTFFRYFESKQDLLMGAGLPWMHPIEDAIRRRPPDEPPLTAIHAVLTELLPDLSRLDASTPAALFVDGPPVLSFGKASRAVILRVENDLADVIQERLRVARADSVDGDARADIRFEAEVLARTAFALFRSVMLRHSALHAAGTVDLPTIATLLDQAFSIVKQ